MSVLARLRAAGAASVRRSVALALLVGLLAVGSAVAAFGQDEPAGTVVDILPIEGTIDPPVSAAIRDLLVDAQARGSDLVVLQLNSAGGLAVDEIELLDAVATSQVPLVKR